MSGEIDEIISKSKKAEFLEALSEALVDTDKAIVALITDKGDGKYTSLMFMLGITTTYEAYGILDLAKDHLKKAVGE